MIKIKNEFEEYKPQIRHKEIDLIQSVINRLAENQLKIKTLCITGLGFLAWIYKNSSDDFSFYQLFICSILVILGSYRLDSSFLEKERLYRMWFEFVQDRRSETKAWLYELNPANIVKILKDQVYIPDQFNPDKIKRTLLNSWSLHFYLFLALMILILYLPAFVAAISIQC